MFLEITFIVLLIIGIFLISVSDMESIGGWLLMICSVIILICNTIELLSPEYDYEILVAERDSYQLSLDGLRAIDNDFETLAIGTDIVDFNKKIAREKIMNKSWFYDTYIDDRIHTLEPIK
jgi:hypothetical protein|tara:strand:- start:24493 stop:24855 length:363 start_codon:yes stop_codon:yes gene_type:complete